MAHDEIYADEIGEITLSKGMVRLDLLSLAGSHRDESNKPSLQAKARIIMPPDGFLRSFSAMENLVKQLVDAGIIKHKAKGADETKIGKGEENF